MAALTGSYKTLRGVSLVGAEQKCVININININILLHKQNEMMN